MLVLILLLGATVSTKSEYDGERDEYSTFGQVHLDVPFDTLVRVASDFPRYPQWSLEGLNGEGERAVTTIMRGLRFRPRGGEGLGVFSLTFDVDLVWPFGSTGNLIHFKVTKSALATSGGTHEVRVRLFGDNILLDEFSLHLTAEPDGHGSRLRFHLQTRFDSFFDAFVSMARYRKSIEWRVTKVVRNLKLYAERRRGG